ncbi:MAG TPA: glutathione S-transferase [Haliangiales bacterium]|nr:glutathione S-transferase [Haliangiales bacterium]
MDLELVIGNKNRSSWSMRPWVLLTHIGVPFRETLLRYHPPSPEWLARMPLISPSGRVPVLLIDGESVWESLSIFEAVAELAPPGAVWPEDAVARRVARSLASEMHAGFSALRNHCPMDIARRAAPAPIAHEVGADLERLAAAWRDARARFGRGGPFLFGRFTGADAMFAPVATRVRTYRLDLPADARAYVDALLAHPAVAAWIVGAQAEVNAAA